jgi:hypothetical protein
MGLSFKASDPSPLQPCALATIAAVPCSVWYRVLMTDDCMPCLLLRPRSSAAVAVRRVPGSCLCCGVPHQVKLGGVVGVLFESGMLMRGPGVIIIRVYVLSASTTLSGRGVVDSWLQHSHHCCAFMGRGRGGLLTCLVTGGVGGEGREIGIHTC